MLKDLHVCTNLTLEPPSVRLISCTMCLVLVAELLLLDSIHRLSWEPWVQAALHCCIFIPLGHLSWHLPLLRQKMNAIPGT